MVARRTLFPSSGQGRRKRARTMVSPAMLTAAKRALRDSSEFKFKNTAGPFFVAPTTGTNIDVTNVAQGTDADDRIGNRITMTRLDVNLLARATDGLRLVLYISKIADSNIGTAPGLNSGLDNSAFWVLHDEIYQEIDGQVAINFKLNKILQLFYRGSAATSYEKNPIRMYLTTVDQTANPNCRCDGVVKLWYKDY